MDGSRALVVDPDGAGPRRRRRGPARRRLGGGDRPGRHRGPRPAAADALRPDPDRSCSLPGLDAFALVREARRTVPGVRVMVVTGHSTETAAIEALNLGVAGYLVKPSRPTEIAATAARVVGA